MAKYREDPCEFYICINQCSKGRKAVHEKYCQKCELYVPRCKQKHENRKKKELEKVRKKEVKNYEGV